MINKSKKIIISIILSLSFATNSFAETWPEDYELAANMAEKFQQELQNWATKLANGQFNQALNQDETTIKNANEAARKQEELQRENLKKIFGNYPQGKQFGDLLNKCITGNIGQIPVQKFLPKLPDFNVCGTNVFDLLANNSKNQNDLLTGSGNLNKYPVYNKIPPYYNPPLSPESKQLKDEEDNKRLTSSLEGIKNPKQAEIDNYNKCQQGNQSACLKADNGKISGGNIANNSKANLSKGGSGGGLSAGGGNLSQGTAAASSEHYSNLDAKRLLLDKQLTQKEKELAKQNNILNKDIDSPLKPEELKNFIMLLPDTSSTANTDNGTKQITKYIILTGETYLQNKDTINNNIKNILPNIDLSVMNYAKMAEIINKTYLKDKESWNSDSEADLNARNELLVTTQLYLSYIKLLSANQKFESSMNMSEQQRNTKMAAENYNYLINIDNNAVITELLKKYK